MPPTVETPEAAEPVKPKVLHKVFTCKTTVSRTSGRSGTLAAEVVVEPRFEVAEPAGS